MAKTATTIQEQIIREGKVQTRPNFIWDQGQGILTAQRFYFQARVGAWLHFFGLLGLLVRRTLPVKVKIVIPLSSITAIGHGRIALTRNVFFMETREGKKYQFRSEYQLWLDVLKDTLQKQTGTMLIQTGQERWEVQR
jgi:hypothetical protein